VTTFGYGKTLKDKNKSHADPSSWPTNVPNIYTLLTEIRGANQELEQIYTNYAAKKNAEEQQKFFEMHQMQLLQYQQSGLYFAQQQQQTQQQQQMQCDPVQFEEYFANNPSAFADINYILNANEEQ
jgi:hypothetical protein